MSDEAETNVESPTVTLPLRIVLDWLLDTSTPAPAEDVDAMNDLIAKECTALGYPSVAICYHTLQAAHLQREHQ